MINYELNGLIMNPALKITASSHRTAFLKPTLFNKLATGFQKKIEPLRINVEQIVVRQPVVGPVVESKPVVSIKQELNNDIKQKNYTHKMENDDLVNSSIVSTAHKLLISNLFLGKLLGNRRKTLGLDETPVIPIVPLETDAEVETDKTPYFQECADLLANKKQYEAAAKQCEQKLASLIKENNISDDELANYINGDIPRTR